MAQGTDGLPFPIGTTFFGIGGTADSTSGAYLEGREFIIPDNDYSVSTAPGGVRKARAYWGTATNFKRVRIVRNASGVTLYPRALVVFKAGQFGKQVDGYARTTAVGPCFPVDEFLPVTGVAANDLFYITTFGSAECLTDTAAGANDVFSQASVLVALTATASTYSVTQMVTLPGGRVAPQDLTGATALLANQVMNRVGIALSASTTANTNVLTDGRKLVHISGQW